MGKGNENHQSSNADKSSGNKAAGIITAIGSLIVAITGLVVALDKLGIIQIGLQSAAETVAVTEIIVDEAAEKTEEEIIPPTEIPTEEPRPTTFNFKTCPQPCSSSGPAYSFPGGIQKIYVEWEYSNFTRGAGYVRSWSMDGQEWIRYECDWPGPESGTEQIELKEPGGLHSGTWEVSVSLDDVIVLQEEVLVEGNWDYWVPAGTIPRCR
jgi:hypothetical protein